MSIYRGAGGSGAAVADSSSEATLVAQLATEAQADADAAQASATAAAGSASTASTQATNAATSASGASTSASAASTSATAAAASASSATSSASTATTQASNASTSATNAANSATSASGSATTATTQATNASTSATNAATSASTASTQATNASASAAAASTSATNAEASYDSFDDRYLGPKASAPTLDNDGNTLLVGALYFNTVSNFMKVWSGSAWLDSYASLSGALLSANNLSDLANTTTARTNLGLTIGTNVQAWDTDLDTWATKTAPSGTVVGTSDSQTLTNKTLALGSNTVSGTLAQFNTAVTDADFASLAGTETLTNKTLTSPVISNGSLNGTTVGATTASTGAFSTLSASSTVSGTGFSTYLASPPAIGGTAAAAVSSTNLAYTGTLTGGTGVVNLGSGQFYKDASGNVGIGTTSNSYTAAGRGNLNIAGSSSAILGFQVSSVAKGYIFHNGTDLQMWNEVAGANVFGTNGAERVRIDSSGNLLVGTTSNSALQNNNSLVVRAVGDTIQNHVSGTVSGSGYLFFGYNGGAIGSITQSGTTAVLYNLTSDARLKTNIVDAPVGNIDNIKVRSFDWKSDNSHVEYGFIAQELAEVAPYAVYQPQDPKEMMAVDYSKLVPMMIKEIQDLKQRIKTLESK